MNNKWLAFFQGIVHVKIVGMGAERFLNLLVRSNIPVWQVKRREKARAVTFCISLPHIGRMRKCARKFDGSVYLVRGEGFPFLLKRMRKSSGFLIGAVSFLFVILLLSNMVWRIDIDGASPEMEYEIRKELNSLGIQKGKIKFSMEDPETIQKELVSKVPGITWIGVNVRGSTYQFQVVEKNTPKTKREQGLQELVASKDAVVVKMFVENGQAMVKRNQFVRKGQLLVSGYIGSEDKFKKVSAVGEVYGETWYKTEVELPLKTSFQVLNGQSERKHYLKAGSVKLPIWGFKRNSFKQYEMNEREHTVSFLGFELPVSYVEKSYYKKEEQLRVFTTKEAEAAAERAARKDMQASLPAKAEIVGEKILHKHTGNGKVKVIIHYQVIENIAIGQPLTQGDRENARRDKNNQHPAGKPE